MYLNITKNFFKAFRLGVILLLAGMSLGAGSVSAQTTITTNFTVNNGNGFVTFNFTNNNAAAVTITNIGSVVNLTSGNADVSGYYKTSAINGAPGAISAANGWNQFGSATITSNGAGTIQPFFTSTLSIPAGATYGICVNSFAAGTTTGALAYSTIAAGTYTFPANNCVLTTGDNIGYAGAGVPAAPANTPRGFIGTVTFTVGSSTPCSGTPNPGATVTSAASVCPNTPFNLSVANATPGSGVTYQYQSGPSATGPFTNIAGATSATYTVANLTTATYYQLLVTCGGVTTASTPVLVSATPTTGCYCIPPAGTATAACNDGDVITNVTIGGINNNSACSNAGPGAVQGYSNYTTTVAAGTVISGAPNPISVNFPGGYTEYVGVWIDYNHNGAFDASEYTYIGTSATGGPLTANINIPATALLGTTRMRVRLAFATTPAATSACTSPTFGETEDYNVNITPCKPIGITGQPMDVSVMCGGTAIFAAADTGSLPTRQWEYRVNASSPWLLVPNAAPYSGVTTDTLTISPVSSAMSGYQYRLLISGACSAQTVSNFGTLTVTPLVLNIPTTSITKCASAAPVLIAVPNTQTTVTQTNSTAYPVPDNDPGPTVSPITIAGVPAGANILSVAVTLNMSHTYPGDMIFNLKAPNGVILNLYKYNSAMGTGASSGVPTWGWYGAKVSSTGTVPFSSVAAPPYIYNSTTNWKADLYNASVLALGFPFNDPAGYPSTATSWAQLASTTQSPNGLWRLAMADGGPGDVGTLSSWTLTVVYGGAPATAVFTPATGLYTNAAGTTPYVAGTAVTQVYANPTASTTYSAVVSSGACSTAAQTIQVNVNYPVGGTATLANSTICAGKNTTFTLGGALTGGPGYTHNFQVSTNNGVTFTNITNGGVYGGANTTTLTLTNVPYSYNGYQIRDSINTPGGCGSFISTVATLTVNPTPVVTISAAPITNIYPGLTTTLTAAVSNATPPITYQWFLNGTAIAGATSNMYTVGVDQEGVYTIQVTDANGCTATAGTSTPASITIGDSVNTNILFIYPSPNSGQFQVRYFNDINNGGTAPAAVNVYDSKGARVFTRSYTVGAGYQAMRVDLGVHSKGLYRVELLDLNGNRIKTGSVMVF